MSLYEKLYKEALERARKFATDLPNGRNDRLYHVWDLESIFPELKESEDEQIKRFIDNELVCLRASEENDSVRYKLLTNAIAWFKGICDAKRELEKQGEQNYDTTKDENIRKYIINMIKSVSKNITVGGWFQDGKKDEMLSYLEKQGEQKPAWSEEDEEQLDRAIYMMEQLDMTKSWDDVYNCLKSLKDRLKGE